MNKFAFLHILFVLLLLTAACRFSSADGDLQPASHGIWVTAYYPVWEEQENLPPGQIDYSAFSNLIQFSILPTASGEIDMSGPQAVTEQISRPVITLAHAAGDRVLICVGGGGSAAALSAAIAEPVRDAFVSSLIDFVTSRGYDGIDLDMEPVSQADEPNFSAFVHELRLALDNKNKSYLLTAAATPEPGTNPAMYAAIQTDLDQINIMTYDLSGKWDGFKTWYNSSLYGEGTQLMVGTVPYPSASEVLQHYIDAGVLKSKLGIGIAFYGDVWSGASGPTQSTDGVTIASIGYNEIMDKYYSVPAYHWDPLAHAPYLSIAATPTTPAEFVTYDDARLAADKIEFAKKSGIGGVTLFEIGDAYRPGQPAGDRDELLQAVKRAWKGPLTGQPDSK